MSSSGTKERQEFLSTAPGAFGASAGLKYFFKARRGRSRAPLTSGKRSKIEKFPPEVKRHTTRLPSILIAQVVQHIEPPRACRLEHDSSTFRHSQSSFAQIRSSGAASTLLVRRRSRCCAGWQSVFAPNPRPPLHRPTKLSTFWQSQQARPARKAAASDIFTARGFDQAETRFRACYE